MKVSKIIGLLFGVCLCFSGAAAELTFEYADGTKWEGEVVNGAPAHLQVRSSGSYTNLEWGKLSQGTLVMLKQMAITNSSYKKLEQYIEPYIEIPEDEIIKKTQVDIKPAPHLDRPAKGSLLGAMFKSSVGLLCLLLLYAANIYAAYEISVIRAYPAAMVCGVAAVAPLVGPIVFLCLKTRLPSREGEEEEPLESPAAAAEAHQPSASHDDPAMAPAEAARTTASAAGQAAAVPQTQVFKRGQFTFNRRFIETKFSTFFTAVRRGDDKDMVLLVKSVRGEHVAARISRISANDMHLEVHKGGASQEVMMPFVEIQEIHLKHKDA